MNLKDLQAKIKDTTLKSSELKYLLKWVMITYCPKVRPVLALN